MLSLLCKRAYDTQLLSITFMKQLMDMFTGWMGPQLGPAIKFLQVSTAKND